MNYVLQLVFLAGLVRLIHAQTSSSTPSDQQLENLFDAQNFNILETFRNEYCVDEENIRVTFQIHVSIISIFPLMIQF